MKGNGTLPLWHDSGEEALTADIIAAGGMKEVAIMLWPAMRGDPIGAAKKIARCLNPNHEQKFSEAEKALIVEAAAPRGSRCYAAYLARLAGAKLQVVAPEDRKQEIIDRFERLRRELRQLTREMDLER